MWVVTKPELLSCPDSFCGHIARVLRRRWRPACGTSWSSTDTPPCHNAPRWSHWSERPSSWNCKYVSCRWDKLTTRSKKHHRIPWISREILLLIGFKTSRKSVWLFEVQSIKLHVKTIKSNIYLFRILYKRISKTAYNSSLSEESTSISPLHSLGFSWNLQINEATTTPK